MYELIFELPFVASTTGDTTRNEKSSARTWQRLREATRDRFGVPDFGTVSFGRGGRARIEPAFLVPFARVVKATPNGAGAFEEDLQKYGVLESAVSQPACKAGEYLFSRLQSNVRSGDVVRSLAYRVNYLLAQMASDNSDIRRLAEQQRNHWQSFSRAEGKFSRLPGRLVRVEGDEALLSVWNEKQGREELRALEASLLSDIGVSAEGDPLILYEAHYTPGVQVSTVVPAVMTTSSADQLQKDEQDLRRYETPLPDVEALEAANLALKKRSVEFASDGGDITVGDHNARNAAG